MPFDKWSVPDNFAAIEQGLYRSSIPTNEAQLPFIKHLQLRSAFVLSLGFHIFSSLGLILSPEMVPKYVQTFFKDNHIELVHFRDCAFWGLLGPCFYPIVFSLLETISCFTLCATTFQSDMLLGPFWSRKVESVCELESDHVGPSCLICWTQMHGLRVSNSKRFSFLGVDVNGKLFFLRTDTSLPKKWCKRFFIANISRVSSSIRRRMCVSVSLLNIHSIPVLVFLSLGCMSVSLCICLWDVPCSVRCGV